MSDTPRTTQTREAQLERQLAAAIAERNEALEQRDKLANAIRSFCTDFESIKWGWDGDCGSARLADALFESLKGVAP